MTQAAKAQEPSMEEILASIRRIIADDDGNKGAAAAKPAAPVPTSPPPAPPPIEMPVPKLEAVPFRPEPDEVDILDLTDPMEASADGFRTHRAGPGSRVRRTGGGAGRSDRGARNGRNVW